MQVSIERRAPISPRIPLDDVLIELQHEDFDEPFEADGLNLGAGGLRMRAAILPDVGSKLRCRFPSPADGSMIAAGCEVVWAEDSGPHVGELGLRFTDLPPEVERHIRAAVGADERAPQATARLLLDGVRSPVVADVAYEADDVLVVEQELSFLQLGNGVVHSERGQRGRLHEVDLRLEDGVPRLVLTVLYEARCAPEARGPESEASVVRDDEVVAIDANDTIRDPSLVSADADEPIVFSVAPPPAEVKPAFRPEPSARVTIERPSLVDALRGTDWPSRLDRARARALDLVAAARAFALACLVRARPWAVAAYQSSLRAARIARARLGPALARVGARAKTFGRAARAAIVARRAASREAGSSRRRRTTSPAPQRRGAEDAHPSASASPAPSRGLRMVIVGLLALAGVGLVVYALRDDGDSSSASMSWKAPIEKPETPEPAADLAIDPIAVERGEAVLVAPPAPPAMPRALPEPTYEAGRMPAPTYPTLRDAARPPEPGTIPAASPYAETALVETAPAAPVLAHSSRAFGDDAVPGGRTFTLQMSLPVREIEGTAFADGFSVLVRGSLSLSRAGPIAAQHSGVERSMILNQGNDSVLTIRFAAGRRPAYRVVADGSTLEVTLGQ